VRHPIRAQLADLGVALSQRRGGARALALLHVQLVLQVGQQGAAGRARQERVQPRGFCALQGQLLRDGCQVVA